MNDKSKIARDPCGQFRDKIPDYLAGTLPGREYPAMETHRLTCAACAKALFDEQRVASLMAEIPGIPVPPDFRDRVVRAWRIKRHRVKDALPVSTLRNLLIAFAIFVIVLLALPVARIPLLSTESSLSSALDNLPPEYRHGIDISISLPAYPEAVATLQTWQGQVFEWLGNLGSALAPWTGLLLIGLVFSALAALAWLWRLRKIGAVHPFS